MFPTMIRTNDIKLMMVKMMLVVRLKSSMCLQLIEGKFDALSIIKVRIVNVSGKKTKS